MSALQCPSSSARIRISFELHAACRLKHTLTTKEYVWVERVRYSALQTPMQSSTGPPGECGRRASAMSHTILQTDGESAHASDTFTCSHQRTDTDWPLSTDVLRRDGVTADSGHLNVSDLLHLQTQVLPLNRHPRPPFPRTRQRVNLWGRRSITYQLLMFDYTGTGQMRQSWVQCTVSNIYKSKYYRCRTEWLTSAHKSLVYLQVVLGLHVNHYNRVKVQLDGIFSYVMLICTNASN